MSAKTQSIRYKLGKKSHYSDKRYNPQLSCWQVTHEHRYQNRQKYKEKLMEEITDLNL